MAHDTYDTIHIILIVIIVVNAQGYCEYSMHYKIFYSAFLHYHMKINMIIKLNHLFFSIRGRLNFTEI